MGDAVGDHHRLIREQIRLSNGYEVKTIGDCFMVAFKHANDAIAFSIGVQLALYEHQWPTAKSIEGVDDTCRSSGSGNALPRPSIFDSYYCTALNTVPTMS